MCYVCVRMALCPFGQPRCSSKRYLFIINMSINESLVCGRGEFHSFSMGRRRDEDSVRMPWVAVGGGRPSWTRDFDGGFTNIYRAQGDVGGHWPRFI